MPNEKLSPKGMRYIQYRDLLAQRAGFNSFTHYQSELRIEKSQNPENKEIGSAVRDGLKRLGKNYRWLAEKIGVSKAAIGYYARGESMPNPEIKEEIYKALGAHEKKPEPICEKIPDAERKIKSKSEQQTNKNISEDVVRLEHLASAIRKTIYADEKNNAEADRKAAEDAQRVMNFFGYSEVILDNSLENNDRDLFNGLEDSKLLSTQEEETANPLSGKEWRTYYWILNRRNILAYSNQPPEQEIAEPEDEDVYASISSEEWIDMFKARNRPEEAEDIA